jgi:hypothetical protein
LLVLARDRRYRSWEVAKKITFKEYVEAVKAKKAS